MKVASVVLMSAALAAAAPSIQNLETDSSAAANADSPRYGLTYLDARKVKQEDLNWIEQPQVKRTLGADLMQQQVKREVATREPGDENSNNSDSSDSCSSDSDSDSGSDSGCDESLNNNNGIHRKRGNNYNKRGSSGKCQTWSTYKKRGAGKDCKSNKNPYKARAAQSWQQSVEDAKKAAAKAKQQAQEAAAAGKAQGAAAVNQAKKTAAAAAAGDKRSPQDWQQSVDQALKEAEQAVENAKKQAGF